MEEIVIVLRKWCCWKYGDCMQNYGAIKRSLIDASRSTILPSTMRDDGVVRVAFDWADTLHNIA
jgi:hypothetical protein